MPRARWRKRLELIGREELDRYLLYLPTDRNETLCWDDVWAKYNSVELEVGCGKGVYLVDRALNHPQTGILGIEYVHKLALCSVDRILSFDANNARVLEGDASAALAWYIPAVSVDVLHVYFPDPWPKRRHIKRRIFNRQFLQHAYRVLKSGAVFNFASDVKSYYDHVLTEFEHFKGYTQVDVWDLNSRPAAPMSTFDRKARDKGSNVYFAQFITVGKS